MSILHRQILKEVISHSLLGLLLFTFLLFLRDTSRLLELMLRDPSSAGNIVYLALLAFPAVLTFTIPMAVLVGVLLGLSRMASDGEVTALRAAGISVRTFFLPVGILAVAGCVLAVYMSAYLAPHASRTRVEIERRIGLRQISAELQPRVFEERFPNLVVYVQDVISGTSPLWKGIFLADLSSPAGPKVTLAREGIPISDLAQNHLQFHLKQGSIHEAAEQPDEYTIAIFSETDIPVSLPLPPPPSVKPNTQSTAAELYGVSPSSAEWLEARVEFHRRFALPLATLLMALVGIPLGLASHKGGKSMGIVLTVLMVLLYYTLFIGGISLAQQGWLSPWAGVWVANLAIFLLGVFMLTRVDRVSPLIGWLDFAGQLPETFRGWFSRLGRRKRRKTGPSQPSASWNPRAATILDRYVVRGFLFYLAVTLAAFLLVIEVVILFIDLLDDVIRNDIPVAMVLDYFLHFTPQLIYLTTPLSVLVAILVCFGILHQNNEITAVKASGVSLFRFTMPVFVVAAMLSAGLFFFEYFYVPTANRHQDAVLNRIKGRPAQTYHRPDRRWIFGQESRIFYYNFFEPTQKVLGGVTVFDLDPETFQITRRVAAARAHWEPSLSGWIFENGWVRELRYGTVVSFEQFEVRMFPELTEEPSYFLKEITPSSQMNFLELRSYIQDLQQSGFDVVPLSVQLHKKFSFPFFTFIMALIGMPFAFSGGKKGALRGIALSFGIAIVYWTVSGLFEALGALNELPAVAAAWIPNLLFGLGGLYLFLKMET